MTMGVELPDGCPPDGHVPADGTYYRLTRGNLQPGDVPGAEDWVLPLRTKKSMAYQKFHLCEAYSYSMFSDVEVLLRARESVPFARKKSISRVRLEPRMGHVLETESCLGPDHYDWWPSSDDFVPPTEVIEGRAS